MIERMLNKGDKLRPLYNNFDFTKMNSDQVFWMDKLALFSKYRNRIIARYNGTQIGSDVKIMFLDQHSMRLGSAIFYNLEHTRQ